MIHNEQIFNFINQNDYENLSNYLINNKSELDIENIKNSDNLTPLFYASYLGLPNIVSILLGYTQDIDLKCHSMTPLWIAAHKGHEKIVEILILNGATIDSSHENGETPLYTATGHKHTAVISTLLKNGADVNSLSNGCTPLFIACSNNDLDTAKILLESKCDINAKVTSHYNRTALFPAITDGGDDIFNFLIDNGSNINITDSDGFTLLMCAAQCGKIHCVKQLIFKDNLSINKHNKYGKTALHYALQENHFEIADLLIANGAQPDISASRVIKQLNLYIENRNNNNPSLEETHAFNQFHRHCSGGTCAGETMIWGTLKPLNLWTLFKNKLGNVSSQIPSHEIDNDFFSVISLLSDWHAKTRFSKGLSHLYLDGLGSYLNEQIFQLNKHSLSFGFKFTKNEFESFLAETLLTTNFMTISNTSSEKDERHVVGISRNEIGQYILLDSNCSTIELLFDSLSSLMETLQCSLCYEDTDIWGISLNIFDYKLYDRTEFYQLIKKKTLNHIFEQRIANKILDFSNAQWNTLLNCIVMAGDTETLKKIQRELTLLNYQEALNEALYLASAHDDYYECLNLLIQFGAQVNSRYKDTCDTPLMSAVFLGAERNMELLLTNKANVNAMNLKKETPLLIAVDKNYPNIVKRLIDADADINHQDELDRSALYLAVYKNNVELTQVLLQKKADTSLGPHNVTPLILATEQNNPQIVELLILFKADINQKNQSGLTALFLAVIKNNLEITKILLKAGADQTLGITVGTAVVPPLVYANQVGFSEITKLLLNVKHEFCCSSSNESNVKKQKIYDGNDQQNHFFAMGATSNLRSTINEAGHSNNMK